MFLSYFIIMHFLRAVYSNIVKLYLITYHKKHGKYVRNPHNMIECMRRLNKIFYRIYKKTKGGFFL